MSGRLGVKLHGIEIAASGAYGAQDLQPESERRQWHMGADVYAELADVELTAEYVRGRAPGASEAGQPHCIVRRAVPLAMRVDERLSQRGDISERLLVDDELMRIGPAVVTHRDRLAAPDDFCTLIPKCVQRLLVRSVG